MRYARIVDPKPPPDRYTIAPADPSTSTAAENARQYQTRPRVDARLVPPETREELVRGHRLTATPANPPHGDQHFRLDYVLGPQLAEGYVGATDLLTRVDSRSDFATDTCIRRDGIDPDTGARWLEELAFEVVAEQSLRDITERAKDLTARGVRRLVAIFVKKGEVAEWAPTEAQWRPLSLDEDFIDPTLRQPLKVRALLDAAEADDAVARALEAKGNPVIAQRESAGRRQGLRQSILMVCERLEIPTTKAQRTSLETLDEYSLESLLDALLRERRWPSPP